MMLSGSGVYVAAWIDRDRARQTRPPRRGAQLDEGSCEARDHPDGASLLFYPQRTLSTDELVAQIPTLASCSFDEIVSCAAPGQVQFLQLYVNKERSITRKFVEHAESRGIKGLFITVDAPQLGRREKDMRM